MSESLVRVYDDAKDTLSERDIPRRRPNETEKEYVARLERWRTMNIVERGAEKLGRFGE